LSEQLLHKLLPTLSLVQQLVTLLQHVHEHVVPIHRQPYQNPHELAQLSVAHILRHFACELERANTRLAVASISS
jgi:hypothetical protein